MVLPAWILHGLVQGIKRRDGTVAGIFAGAVQTILLVASGGMERNVNFDVLIRDEGFDGSEGRSLRVCRMF